MKKFKKLNITSFFERNFSFEHGVDLNDEVEVLYRKNIVIKNIIFVINVIYSLILFTISIGSPSNGNWLWSVIPLPLTFAINQTIKKIINREKQELVWQQIAMYMCSFYMFLSAILVYIKLNFSMLYYAEASYMLIYLALIVVSFYQDKKMIKNIYGWMLALVTVIHLTVTYSLTGLVNGMDVIEFIKSIPTNNDAINCLRDIFLRTIVMLSFMLAIYIITDIGQKMSEERKVELSKRQEIQEDFTKVVKELYNVLLETNVGYDEDVHTLPLLASMSKKLASLCGLSPQKCDEISDYALFNKDHQLDLKLEEGNIEQSFDKLHEQTSMGAMIAKRMQLTQKCENIVRAHIEGWNDQEFQIKMLNMQNNIESQIILLCDMYIALRSVKSYKRPCSHKTVMDYFEQEFQIYFNNDIYNRFVKFDKDFEKMYNEYEAD